MTALLAFAGVLLASAPGGDYPTVIAPKDFVEYWSAARVHASGGNPYDGRQILPLQQLAAGKPEQNQPTMLWTPPWTLPLYLPFGAFEPRPAHLAWLVVQAGCVLLSAVLLWKQFGGDTRPAWWLIAPVSIALLFGPCWWLIDFGQNAGLILLGLAGFLTLRSRGYPIAAGAVGSLTAVKPHLLALFGVAMLLDGITTSAGRRVLFGGVLTLVIGSGLAMVPNPDVFAQFKEALARPHSNENPAVTEWQVPLLSYKLRWAIDPQGGQPFWTQFVPCALGSLAVVPYWWRRRRTWDWVVETPRLVLASLLLAPYGAWMFDLTILLVPVVQAFVWAFRSRMILPIFAAIAGQLAISFYGETTRILHESIWATPAVIVWYAAVAILSRSAVSKVEERRT